MIVLLCSCNTENIQKTSQEQYIEPVRSVNIFDEADKELQDRIKKANNGKGFDNYQFKMLFKDIYDGPLYDIDGKRIILKDYEKLFVEIVSTKCSHCRKQLEFVEEFSEKEDVAFVQYFNVGNRQEIFEFYAEAGVNIPQNIIIIPHDEGLKDYIIQELDVQLYPTLLSFVDGKLSFTSSGEIDAEQFENIYDISFIDKISMDDLILEDGNNIIEMERDIEDVRSSLSQENQDRLAKLDNDGVTSDLTLSIIGSSFDYDLNTKKTDSVFINEIDDFNHYKDKKTVIFYTYLRDPEDTDKIIFINDLIRSNDEYEYITVLSEGMESSSTVYRKTAVKFNCPVVSLSAELPSGFYFPSNAEYPYALFVDRSVITGAYSNIKDVESFNQALDIFLSDGSIAYVRNN